MTAPLLPDNPTLIEAMRYEKWWGYKDNCLTPGHSCRDPHSPCHRAVAVIQAAAEEDKAAAEMMLDARHRRGTVSSPIAYTSVRGCRPVIYPVGGQAGQGVTVEESPAEWGEPICVDLVCTGAVDSHAGFGLHILWPGDDRTDPPAVTELFGGGGNCDSYPTYAAAWVEHNRLTAGKPRVGRSLTQRDAG